VLVVAEKTDGDAILSHFFPLCLLATVRKKGGGTKFGIQTEASTMQAPRLRERGIRANEMQAVGPFLQQVLVGS
jgi:hypothetical protein